MIIMLLIILGFFNGKEKNKKLKRPFEIDERTDKKLYNKKMCKDIIWLLWSAILIEAATRNEFIHYQINCLYQLFKYDIVI